MVSAETYFLRSRLWWLEVDIWYDSLTFYWTTLLGKLTKAEEKYSVQFWAYTWDLMWAQLKIEYIWFAFCYITKTKESILGKPRYGQLYWNGWLGQRKDDVTKTMKKMRMPFFSYKINQRTLRNFTTQGLHCQVAYFLDNKTCFSPNLSVALIKTTLLRSHSKTYQASILLHIPFRKSWIFLTIPICTWFRVLHGRKVSSSYTGVQ